ncbi:MAG: hypothetical protein IJW88_10490 [Alistipes sp.]|nr:hypothetical protein [Alistipes sp.]MBQ7311933.1 hypothetical protein [Alistipes sp.]
MRKYLAIYAIVATAVIVVGAKYLLKENARLENNNSALLQSVKTYRTKADENAASVQVLRLKIGEYEELRAADAERIRKLGIKLKRLESASKSVTKTAVNISAPLRDTVILRDTLRLHDTVRLFRWRDSWVTVDGVIDNDSVSCSVTSVDTLHQIIHRIPRRFLFFRYGTKAIRQEIVSSNPHTEVVYSEVVTFR